MIVIGLVGAKGSGKSTFAQIARKRFPETLREGALADRLKEVCAGVFGIQRGAFDSPERKERYVAGLYNGHEYYGPVILQEHEIAVVMDRFQLPLNDEILRHDGTRLYTPRQVAQYVGTEVLRAVDPDVHCKGLMLTVQEMTPQPECLVVTDLRFPNELAFFMNRFGSNFYPTYVSNGKAEAAAEVDRHESERHVLDLAKSCMKVNNNGSMEDFETRVENYLDGILKGVPR